MELILFFIKNNVFAFPAQVVTRIENIHDMKDNYRDIERVITVDHKEYLLSDLYKKLYNENRNMLKSNDYILFLKNNIFINCEKILRLQSSKIFNYNFELILGKKYGKLYSGVFIFKDKIGLILNEYEIEELL